MAQKNWSDQLSHMLKEQQIMDLGPGSLPPSSPPYPNQGVLSKLLKKYIPDTAGQNWMPWREACHPLVWKLAPIKA